MTNELVVTTKRKNGRKYKPTDPDFVAPDGRWGWLVAVACGLGNLSILSMYHEFGLVFNDKFETIGITHAQTTTVFNINLALSSCVGLLNGPIYRTFSFRQVGFFGSTMVVCSLLIVTWCKSFWSYFVFYGILYGSSIGITQSANALALNTYFKQKRSIATGISWGITGMGPIIWPYIITILMNYYEMEGTLLLFAGFAGHAIMCSLLLQPVHWHTKYREETEVPLMPVYPKTGMVRSNSLPIYRNILDEITIASQPLHYIDTSLTSIKDETDEIVSSAENIKLWINASQDPFHKSDLNISTKDNSVAFSSNDNILKNDATKQKTSNLKKFMKSFDLDILKDLVYLNIIFGMITICFVEFNLAILTPAILKEFKFEKYQIATYLSLLAVIDVTVRFSVPFFTRKIKLNSRIYFLFGILLTTTSRIVLIHTQQFHISLFVAVVYGFGKGLGIVYVALLIPNHVSLQKLPAALGIYLATFGIFSILMAPVAGWIRDITQSYVTTVHILQIFNYIAALSWAFEYLSKKKRVAKVEQ